MLAWRTELYGMTSIVKAATRSQACYFTVSAAKEAGWKADVTGPVRAWRAPKFDALKMPARTCWSPETAERELASPTTAKGG